MGLDKTHNGSEFIVKKGTGNAWTISFKESDSFSLANSNRAGKVTDQPLVVLSEDPTVCAQLQPRHDISAMSWSYGTKVRFNYAKQFYLHAHSAFSLNECDWFEATWFPFNNSDGNDYWITERVPTQAEVEAEADENAAVENK